MASTHSITRYGNTRQRRAVRTRGKIRNSELPRLAVFRSNKYIYAQIIATDGKTLAGLKGKTGSEVGEKIAKKASEKKVSSVVFDRGGYRYHGHVKAVAEAAREGGLKI